MLLFISPLLCPRFVFAPRVLPRPRPRLLTRLVAGSSLPSCHPRSNLELQEGWHNRSLSASRTPCWPATQHPRLDGVESPFGHLGSRLVQPLPLLILESQ